MSTPKAAAAGAALALASGLAYATETPDLGHVATQGEIAAWDISIPPSGKGLPGGSGTAKQGGAIYALKCVSCHGEKGTGKPADQLVGGIGSLTTDHPVKTVGSYWPYATTLFDYIRRAMPFTAPQSLSNDGVYALCAYILALNGIISENDPMNARTLPKVKMPNHDAFFSVYPGNLP